MNGAALTAKRQDNARFFRKLFNYAATVAVLTAGLSGFVWTHQGPGQMLDLDKNVDNVTAQILKNEPGSNPDFVRDHVRDVAFHAESLTRSMTMIFTGLALANTAFWYRKTKRAEELVKEMAPRNDIG